MKSHHQFNYQIATKRPTKKNSTLTLHDKSTGAKYEFQEEKTLGSGTYGSVRLFSRSDRATDEKLAVKLPFIKNPLSKEDYLSIKNDVTREFKYLRKAYPHEIDFALKHFAKEKLNHDWQYTWRMIMPFFNGVKLDDYIKKEKLTTHDLANIFIGILEALQNLHDKDIIHGDIAGRNIMVCSNKNELKFYFIDFGMAYSRRGKATTGFVTISDNPDESLRMAKERVSEKQLKAHPSQDVCSIGKTILDALKDVPRNLCKKFEADYPNIMEFCAQAVDDDPENRPDIVTFLAKIKPTLNWRHSLSDELQELLTALNKSDSSSARKILESNSRFRTSALNDFLDILITQREYAAAARLMNMKKRLTPNATSDESYILDFYQFMHTQTQPEIIEACEFISELIKQNDVEFNDDTLSTIEEHDELNSLYSNLLDNNIIMDNNPRNQFYGW